MTDLTEYAVFEFLAQGKNCYRVSSVKRGISLMQYVKQKEHLPKERFYQWIFSMVEQVELYVMSADEGNPSYGFVNPLAIILAAEDQVYLLDDTAEENAELVKRMQKRNFKVLFVREERSFTPDMELQDDLYGLGKSIQFLWSRGQLDERISTLETWYLHRIVEKCLTDQGDVWERLKWVKKEVMRLRKNKQGKGRTMRRNVLVAVLSGILLLAIGRWKFAEAKPIEERQAEAVVLQEKKETTEENLLQYVAYELPFLQAYARKDDSESWRQVRKIAETVLKNPDWDRLHELQSNEVEIRLLLAEAYDFEGDTGKAAYEYKKLKKLLEQYQISVDAEKTEDHVLEKKEEISP